MSDVDMRALLVKVLSEFVVTIQPHELTKPDSRYTVAEYMALTDLLFRLKGVKGKTFTIGGDDE